MFQRVGDKAFKKDLTNTLALLEALDKPHLKFQSIHIAGTNGKGSVSHILASVFQESGFKTGCYTSPHYKDFRERIKINGQVLSEDYVVDFVQKHKELIERIQPSFFEITVAMAFDYFAKQQVDIAIIETGMGGRFDSTNVISPLLSIITNISFDHQQFLGDTLAKIAFEKAGIIKPETPVLIGERQEEIEEVFLNKALECDSNLFYADELFEIVDFETNLSGSAFTTHFGKRKLHYSSDLSGFYQKYNLQTAMAAILLLKDSFELKEENIRKGIEGVRKNSYFLGRCMKIKEKPLALVDSAHNEAGIRELLKIISSQAYKTLHFVYGTVADKDLSKVFNLLPKEAQYYFCKADIPRGMSVEELTKFGELKKLNSKAYPSVQEAYKAAVENADPKEDMILISGSIFVVAEVLP